MTTRSSSGSRGGGGRQPKGAPVKEVLFGFGKKRQQQKLQAQLQAQFEAGRAQDRAADEAFRQYDEQIARNGGYEPLPEPIRPGEIAVERAGAGYGRRADEGLHPNDKEGFTPLREGTGDMRPWVGPDPTNPWRAPLDRAEAALARARTPATRAKAQETLAMVRANPPADMVARRQALVNMTRTTRLERMRTLASERRRRPETQGYTHAWERADSDYQAARQALRRFDELNNVGPTGYDIPTRLFRPPSA